MTDVNSQIDRSAFTVTTFAEADEQDKVYWHSLSPQERLAALEVMRQINYAYNPLTDRIQRTVETIEIIERS